MDQVLNGHLANNGMCLLCASIEVGETALQSGLQVPTMLQDYKCSLLRHSAESVRAEEQLWSAVAEVSVFQVVHRRDGGNREIGML